MARQIRQEIEQLRGRIEENKKQLRELELKVEALEGGTDTALHLFEERKRSVGARRQKQ